MAYVDSSNTAHLYVYSDINPDLAAGLARSFFEMKKREDQTTGSTYINELMTAASYADEATLKDDLATFAREIYTTGGTPSSSLKDIFEIKRFFEDLVSSIQNISCNSVLQSFTAFIGQ